MKNVWKVLGILCLVFVMASCSKDDDPANNDLFVGTYHGSVGYKDDDSDVSSDNSSVTVVKVGSGYNFKFNEGGIPPLTGVKFKKDGDHGVINVDFEEGIKIVTIDESNLTIVYTKDDQTWRANCSRK